MAAQEKKKQAVFLSWQPNRRVYTYLRSWCFLCFLLIHLSLPPLLCFPHHLLWFILPFSLFAFTSLVFSSVLCEFVSLKKLTVQIIGCFLLDLINKKNIHKQRLNIKEKRIPHKVNIKIVILWINLIHFL